MMKKKIAIVMGSKSDLPIIEPAIEILRAFGIEFCVRVLSAHRTPDQAALFARDARREGYGVILAAAGKAAALPGALAACTTLPVVGIPVKASALDGLDALLSMVQMPPGIPVATVAIDGAKNAALLALAMLSIDDADLAGALQAYRARMADEVLDADQDLSNRFK